MAKKYDIAFFSMGNGWTIANRAEEENGDYKKIAHIGRDRKITWYDNNLPADIKKQIEDKAKGKNEPMSASQKDMMIYDESKSKNKEVLTITEKSKLHFADKIIELEKGDKIYFVNKKLCILKEDDKWMQQAFSKNKGLLHKKLGVPEDETIPMEKINSELSKLHAKVEKGEKLSDEELKFERELNAAKNAKEIN